MAPRIPEGYVFVSKSPGVAAALLEAADRIGADRKWGVRTVAGGYHVLREIAAEYGVDLEVDEDVDEDEDQSTDGESDEAGETDEVDGDASDTEGQSVDGEDDEVGEAEDDDQSPTEVADDVAADGDEAESEPVPDETWDWRAINNWAAKQDPPIQFPKGATVSEKISIIHNNG
jgi:hypothetical protein